MFGFRKRRVIEEESASALVPERHCEAPPPIDAAVPEHLETATFAAG